MSRDAEIEHLQAQVERLEAEVVRLGHESRMWRGEVRIRGMRRAGEITQRMKELRYALSEAKTLKQWERTRWDVEKFLQLLENAIGEFYEYEQGGK